MFALFQKIAALVTRPQKQRERAYDYPINYPLEHFEDLREYAIDLSGYLATYARVNSCVIGSRFSVLLWHGQGTLRTHAPYDRKRPFSQNSSVFRDTEYGFILCHCDKFIEFVACVGFDIDDNGTVIIEQIQGVRGKKDVLCSLRWEKMLIALVIDWARTHGRMTIKIQRAENNKWFSETSAERRERMRLHYNTTAQRCGFRPDQSDEKMFVRILA